MYFFQFVRIRSRSLLVKIKSEFVSMIILAADFVTATFQIQVNSQNHNQINLVLALIDGTCDVPLELRESCEQKIGGGEITSVSRCASAECCFETGSFSQRVDCFKKRAAISDESLVLNWDADRVYVSYLYNHWLNTVQLFTAEANSTGPPLFPGVKHMFF